MEQNHMAKLHIPTLLYFILFLDKFRDQNLITSSNTLLKAPFKYLMDNYGFVVNT